MLQDDNSNHSIQYDQVLFWLQIRTEHYSSSGGISNIYCSEMRLFPAYTRAPSTAGPFPLPLKQYAPFLHTRPRPVTGPILGCSLHKLSQYEIAATVPDGNECNSDNYM